ncbi:MAG: hypothetical protein QME66_09945 [Candidatus Eisenbacteria bacterium]|nr:hypothetical protein [Candidatus Eisenbacteria bacterium]
MRPRTLGPLLVILLFLLPSGASASFLYVPRTPRSTGMGGSDAFLEGGSLFISPVGLVETGVELRSGFSRPFGLDGVSLGWIQGSFGRGWFSAGSGIGKFSAEGYGEMTALFSFAARRMRGEALGVTLKFMETYVGQDEPEVTYGIDCGMKKTWRFICAGIGFRNINFPEPQCLGPGPEIMVGLGIAPKRDLLLAVELERELGEMFEPRAGIEVKFSPNLYLRGGFFLEPTRITSGIGFSFGKMQFDYSYLTHEELGGTHDFSVGVR